MSKILEILDKLARRGHASGWEHPSIRTFVETGDEKLLKGIPRLQNAWIWEISEALPEPDAWTEEASRVLKLAVRKGADWLLSNYLCRHYGYGWPQWNTFGPMVEVFRRNGVDEPTLREFVIKCNIWDSEQQKPTPAAELVLQASEAELRKAFTNGFGVEIKLAALLAHSQPEKLEKLLAGGLGFSYVSECYNAMCRANPARFAGKAFEIFNQLTGENVRISMITTLGDAAPDQYRERAYAEVRAILAQDRISDNVTGRDCAKYVLKHDLPDALPLVCKWMANFDEAKPWDAPFQRDLVLKWAAEHAPRFVLPMAQACTRSSNGSVIHVGLTYWKEQGIADAGLFHEAVKRLLAVTEPSELVAGIAVAREWNVERAQEDLWPLMLHKSRPVRSAAARALAVLGYTAAGERTEKLLEHKKADVRQSAVMLLSQLGGEDALRVLKQRLDVEENDDVRDNILLVLESSGKGAALSPEEQKARIAKTLAKVKGSPADWIKPDALAFRKQDGTALTPEETLYLLIRQSRCKAMRADLEARPLYAQLDRKASASTALALLEAFLGSKQDAAERWVLALAALTGDDRLVPVLRKAILDWADKSRGKLAEYGVQALALLGTDAALMVVDSLSVRFRSKNKNIGQAAAEAFAAAAEARKVTIEELGDLVVPWLGFEPGKPRLIETSKSQVEARIDSELKLSFRDVKTGKLMSKLPSGAPAETQAEFKVLAGTIKEAVKAQLLRIETLLVRQFRWPVGRWRDLYLAHPLLRPFTQRLVWGWRDAAGKLRRTFRALEDGTLTDVADDPVALPDDGSVSLVHPLDLDEEARTAWLQHLADYEITPPFPQLDRPVVRVKPEEAATRFGKHVMGVELNAMTFRSRAEKLGWTRGSVCDAGAVTSYRKVFSGAGVEAFLGLEGMYVGIGTEETITLDDVFFVKSGAVQVGSYTYDEPYKEDDSRVMPFGEVPAVPFSEIMGDLGKISGKNAGNAENAEAAAQPE